MRNEHLPVIIVTTIIFVCIFLDQFSIENESALDYFVIEKLYIPIIVLGISTSILLFRLKDEYRIILNGTEKNSWRRIKLALLLLTTSLSLMLVYFLLIKCFLSSVNHSIGNQNRIIVSGPIIDKWITNNRGSSSYNFKINSFNLERNVILEVNHTDYWRYDIGEAYTREATKGSLGFIYYLK